MVSCLSRACAMATLVPTPSVDVARTGRVIRVRRLASKRPAKPPRPPSTSGRWARRIESFISSTALSPASTSTPASAYVTTCSTLVFGGGISERSTARWTLHSGGPTTAATAQDAVCLADLVHEGALEDAQPHQVDAQNGVATDRDGVRAKVVVGDAQTLGVLRSVDLDDELEVVPPDVEVDLAARTSAHDLAAGFGQAALTAQPREVQLAQRVRAVGEVSHDAGDERPATSAVDPPGRALESLGGDDPLLNGDAEEQCRLAVGDRPMCGADSGDRRMYARHPGRRDVAPIPASDLVDADAAHRKGPAGVTDREVDLRRAEVAGAGGDERRDSVQRSDLRPGFDDRPPRPGRLRQLTGVDAYGLTPEKAPPSRRHHVANREPIQAERRELAAADHAVPLRSQVLRARQQSGGASSRTHPRTMDPRMRPKRGREAPVDNRWRVLRALGRSDIPPPGKRRPYGLRARR